MDLTLTPSGSETATVLCSDSERSVGGTPVGPGDLTLVEAPGVEMREFIGADRVFPEHVRCDHGTLAFRATRVYSSPALALAYVLSTLPSEPVAGTLKYGNSTVFSHAVVTSRRVALVGCTVVVNYQIEG